MDQPDKKYRLITRSDFDGLACAILLKELDLINEIKFVHPKDVQDGKVEVTNNDILTNLPYVETCHLCFDHHASEEIRNKTAARDNYILQADAESAARVVYNYYGGLNTFGSISPSLIGAVDKADSGQFTMEDVIEPGGWELVSFLMDARTGLGRFKEFRVSNYQLMMDLIDYCRNHDIDEVLSLRDVQERIELYEDHEGPFREQLRRVGKPHEKLVVLDLRNEETIYAGNRFVIYALFPECNISMHVLWGREKQNTVFAIGKSIFNRTSPVDIGALCLEYGGGGHEAAGTCQVANNDAERVLGELIDKINALNKGK